MRNINKIKKYILYLAWENVCFIIYPSIIYHLKFWQIEIKISDSFSWYIEGRKNL